MLEHLWLPCMATVAAIALSAIVFKEFLKKRADQSAVKGSACSCPSPRVEETATDYEVFLSFRGPDTRSGFTDYLYTSLTGAGIRTFKDDKDLPIGEEFDRELPQAINQSKISIPIFSKNYAASVWCLKELVQMVKCRENGRQKIMPIFYDVEPSEVRYQHQTEGYANALLSHKKKGRYDEDTICEWKAALSAVGAINGWVLHGKTDRREGEFAKEVTDQVFRELKKAYLAISDCLVSVDNQVDEIKEMIGTQTSETRIIGIHGMGGIGKTTIAKIVYNQLSSNFKDCCCFLADIREMSARGDIKCLQKQLISDILKEHMDIKNVDEGTGIIKNRLPNKKVLLLLDDVEKASHIDAFVGKRDWFGRGSKIIITTRNKDILCFPRVDCSYELKCMDRIQSLKLFSKHAFRRDSPLDEDMNQSNRAIDIAKGLPLALEVIGSLLCHIKRENWDGKLMELENVPPEDILQKLEVSYNALPKREQLIFLDIACLFIGYEKDVVIYFWNKPTFFPKGAMDVLENMSLMKIDDDNKVWMHDQLRDLGREIVRRESNLNIEEQSRVWDPEEALGLLRSQEKKKKLKALRLHLDHQHRFAHEDFKRLPNLSFLEVCGSKGTFCAEERLLWHASPSNVFPTNEDSHLLPKLRWLSWHDIPPTFNITNFSTANVVILNLSQSEITDDWKGWSHVKLMKNLKVMDLSHCDYLERTPDFSAHSKLEHLILKVCQKLVEIDESICQLESLVFLDITSTRIKELPDSIEKLTNLKVVKMNRCCTSKIPDALWRIEKLEVIEAEASCDFDVKIGNDIHRNQSLRILKLIMGRIYVVPRLPNSLTILKLSKLYMNTFPDLSNLTNLEKLVLHFARCDSDRESDGPVEKDLPRRIGNLSKLESLFLESPDMTALPDISLLPHLKSLTLWCHNLPCLPSLPSGLSSLWLESKCVTTLPEDISTLLPRLEILKLRWCFNLRYLPSLPSSLCSLFLSNCKSCCSIGNLSNLKTLASLIIVECAISEIQGLACLENLDTFKLRNLQRVGRLPDLRNLNKLWRLQVSNCGNLVEIQGELPSSLGALEILDCGSLQKWPDLSSLKSQNFLIKGCGKLNEAISSLFPEEEVESEGGDIESDDESEGEDDESGCESDYELEGED